MMQRDVKPAHWNKYAQDVIDTNGYPSKTLEQYVEEAGVKTNQTGILQAAPITNLPPALENRPIIESSIFLLWVKVVLKLLNKCTRCMVNA